jgi:hypothetical protein
MFIARRGEVLHVGLFNLVSLHPCYEGQSK